MRNFFLLFILIGFVSLQSVLAQTAVTGTVTSAADGGTLPGVSVVVKGTNLGTTTDINGKYQLNVPKGASAIVFSFVGMETQTVAFSGQKTINVALRTSTQNLNEVIVVAYGTAKKGAFTGSAAQLNSDQIELRPLTNATTALEGASPGIQVASSNGQPGSGISIRIRGFGSVSASSAPLYVVDGVPFSGDINSINPDDIESISVLKDAASTALYGNKASNGVVLITTKKGHLGKGRLSVSASEGITGRAIPEYNRVGPADYYTLFWEAIKNSKIYKSGYAPADAAQYATDHLISELGYNIYNVPDDQLVGTDGQFNSSASILPGYDDLDWEKALTRVGHRRNYDVGYQGATKKTNYYFSVGYLKETGYTIASDFQRFSGRANINTQATKWFKTGLNIAASTSKSNQAYQSSSNAFVNPFRFARQIGPIYPIYEHDPTTGEYILDDNGNKIYDINDHRPGGASTGRHIIAETLWNQDLDETTNLSARTYAEVKFYKDLTLTVNASLDKRFYYNTNFDNKYVGDGAPGGRAYRTFSRRTAVNFNQLLNYTKSFGNNNIKLLLGHENYDYKYNNLYGARTTIIADGNTELINFVTTTDLSSYMDSYKTEGYFTRLNYDYNNKYFITGSFRRDGSSKFAPQSRWGNFWSVGSAWRLDQEDFIKNVSWIDLLKFRASYGQVGNDAGINYYAFQALYALDYNNQSESGYIQSKLPADSLVWESSNSYDVAIEFGFLKRLSGTIEFYRRITSDMIFPVPLPLSSGLSSHLVNIGTMYNQGIEFSLSADIIRNKNFKWNLNFNFSTIDNQFTKLPQDEIISGSKKLMVGHSIYDFWLREWYGVDPDDGAALYYADDPTASGVRIIGNDTLTPNVNNARYGYVGTAIPNLFGAFTNTFTYKNFEATAMFTYQLGGKVLDYNWQAIMSSGTYGGGLSSEILKRWQKPGDITDVPRMDVSQTSNFNATSSRWLVDASYLNLRQVTLAYRFPERWVKNLSMSSARIYLSGENLFLINALKGMNVQQNFAGYTSNVYTPSRVISLGVDVKF